MLDTRVLKKMAEWLFYMVTPFVVFTALIWIGHNVFEVGPDTVVNSILIVCGVCGFYHLAKIKVDMERDAEQRVANQIKDAE